MKAKKMKNLFLYFPLLIIMVISLFVMYHARILSPLFFNHYKKQAIFLGLGIFLLCFKNKIKRRWLFDNSFYFYVINCLLLFLVLFVGETTNGAKAWFHFGFFSFQPSELMKLSLCLFLTSFTDKQVLRTKKDQFYYLIKVFLIILVPSILVFLEPDTGAILFYIIIALAIAFSTNISKRWIFCLVSFFCILIGLFFYFYYFARDFLIQIIGTSFFYRVERLLNFQQGLQIENALTSIGSAPFFLFNLNESRIYIPEAPTDFAFALTANVFGIFGILVLLSCYLAIDLFLIRLWQETKKNRDKFFVAGFLLMFLFNQLQNILMNLGLVPIMGIPLPFLSYGGSTTIVSFLFLMILLQKE